MEKKTIYPTINKELYELLKKLAKDTDVPINSLLEEAIKLLLTEKQKRQQ